MSSGLGVLDSEDAIELGHALPRAAFALVFFPDDVP